MHSGGRCASATFEKHLTCLAGRLLVCCSILECFVCYLPLEVSWSWSLHMLPARYCRGRIVQSRGLFQMSISSESCVNSHTLLNCCLYSDSMARKHICGASAHVLFPSLGLFNEVRTCSCDLRSAFRLQYNKRTDFCIQTLCAVVSVKIANLSAVCQFNFLLPRNCRPLDFLR